jgi:hypothetical protein
MQSRDQINLEPWLCKAYVRARLGGIASFVKDGAAKLCRAKIGGAELQSVSSKV